MEQQARKLIALEAQEPLARRADGMWSIWLDAVKRMPDEQKQAELDILSLQWADMSAKEPPYLPAQADWDALFCMMRPLADWWHRADQERFESWRQALHAEPAEQVAKAWAAEIAAVEAGRGAPKPQRLLSAFDIHCNEYGEFRKQFPMPAALAALGRWGSPPSHLAISRDLWNAR
ncbi:hypothetical protein ACQCQP_01265 [Ralstonia pseudosolanacearum]|uniref:hypothetical protein n=1 Tax=Ralstonia pseudosolanacearum TaxID=1310165 RepID=UPI000DAEB7D2|nr:hypothetical protein [Ralstonia pseudosolanacearum]RAA08717.1 hypothetical protein DOT79_23085 [Ralstonia pseudosolanacearum]